MKYIKRYEDDPAKYKARELVGNSLDETLLSFKKPTDLQVVCFDGIDGMEFSQIYGRRGIPESNFLSIERDKKVAAEYRRRFPNRRVFEGTLEDWATRPEAGDFDVYSFDYIGPVLVQQLQTYNQLARQSKRKQLLVHVSNALVHDAKQEQLYGHSLVVHDASTLGTERELYSEFKTKRLNGDSLTSLKKTSHAFCVEHSLTINDSVESNLTWLKKILGDKLYSQYVKSWNNSIKPQSQLDPSFYEPNCYQRRNITNQQHFAIQNFVLSTTKRIGEAVATKLNSSELESDIITSSVSVAINDSRRFDLRKLQKYEYISTSATSMIGTIIFFDTLEKYQQSAIDAISCIKIKEEPLRIEINPEINKHLRRFWSKYYGSKDLADDVPIINFGSSAKPMLTKSKFDEDVAAGKELDDILHTYRGWKNKPVTQWWHDAKGSNGVEELVSSAKEATFETITKADAYALLEAGFSPREIAENYQGFSKGQLAAYKAWITMNAKSTHPSQTQ